MIGHSVIPYPSFNLSFTTVPDTWLSHLDLTVLVCLPPELVEDAGADGGAPAADDPRPGEVSRGDQGAHGQHHHLSSSSSSSS